MSYQLAAAIAQDMFLYMFRSSNCVFCVCVCDSNRQLHYDIHVTIHKIWTMYRKICSAGDHAQPVHKLDNSQALFSPKSYVCHAWVEKPWNFNPKLIPKLDSSFWEVFCRHVWWQQAVQLPQPPISLTFARPFVKGHFSELFGVLDFIRCVWSVVVDLVFVLMPYSST